jgi:hypothetical protein
MRICACYSRMMGWRGARDGACGSRRGTVIACVGSGAGATARPCSSARRCASSDVMLTRDGGHHLGAMNDAHNQVGGNFWVAQATRGRFALRWPLARYPAQRVYLRRREPRAYVRVGCASGRLALSANKSGQKSHDSMLC